MAQLPPTAKLEEDPEFSKLVMPAEAIGSMMRPGSRVHCAMRDGALLGVFSSEAAASEYCTHVEGASIICTAVDTPLR